MRTERILTFRIAVPSATYSSPARISDFYERLAEGLDSHPGVESAAAVFRLPVRQSTFTSRFFMDGRTAREQERAIGVQVVTPTYFQTLDVRILRGRGMTGRTARRSTPVVLINETAAKWLFPGEDPIGRRLVQLRLRSHRECCRCVHDRRDCHRCADVRFGAKPSAQPATKSKE